MALIDDIYKPTAVIIPIEGSGSDEPANCTFQVTVKFKEIEGVIPYPDLIYTSKVREIGKSQANANFLIESLENRITKHKKEHTFLKQKQKLVNDFLTTMWGV